MPDAGHKQTEEHAAGKKIAHALAFYESTDRGWDCS